MFMDNGFCSLDSNIVGKPPGCGRASCNIRQEARYSEIPGEFHPDSTWPCSGIPTGLSPGAAVVSAATCFKRLPARPKRRFIITKIRELQGPATLGMEEFAGLWRQAPPGDARAARPYPPAWRTGYKLSDLRPGCFPALRFEAGGGNTLSRSRGSALACFVAGKEK